MPDTLIPSQRTAHLEWFPRIKRWRIKPAVTTGISIHLTDSTLLRPLAFKTIDKARARLESEGYELGEVRQ